MFPTHAEKKTWAMLKGKVRKITVLISWVNFDRFNRFKALISGTWMSCLKTSAAGCVRLAQTFLVHYSEATEICEFVIWGFWLCVFNMIPVKKGMSCGSVCYVITPALQWSVFTDLHDVLQSVLLSLLTEFQFLALTPNVCQVLCVKHSSVQTALSQRIRKYETKGREGEMCFNLHFSLNRKMSWPLQPTVITYESVINTLISKWKGENFFVQKCVVFDSAAAVELTWF